MAVDRFAMGGWIARAIMHVEGHDIPLLMVCKSLLGTGGRRRPSSKAPVIETPELYERVCAEICLDDALDLIIEQYKDWPPARGYTTRLVSFSVISRDEDAIPLREMRVPRDEELLDWLRQKTSRKLRD